MPDAGRSKSPSPEPGLDALAQLVCWKDRDLRYLGCNRAFARAVGLTGPAQVEGKTDAEIGWAVEVGERGVACREAERGVVQSGVAELQVHLKGTLPGNRGFCYLVSRVPMFADDGSVAGVVVTYENIGEWVSAQDMLHRARRMEGLAALAGGVGVELDRIKATLMGCLDRLRSGIGPGDPQKRELDELIEVGRHAGMLARQLRIYAGRQIAEPVEFSLGELMEKMLTALRRLAGTSVSVQLEPPSVVPMVRSDPRLVEQAVVNLVRFARHCMPAGGTVTVSTGQITLGHLEALRLGVSSGEYLVLRSHHGCEGLSPGTAAHLFEPYFVPEDMRRRDETPGSGLELAVLFGVARQTGGGVRAGTDAEGMLTVEVFFPRVYASSKNARAEPESPMRLRGTERLLVAADGSSLRAAMVSLLSSLGYRVSGAALSDNLVDLVTARRSDERPVALMVVDTTSDSELARETLARIRTARPDLRVLALHGRADPRDDEPTLEVGWLAKPFRFEALAHSVRQLLDAR